MQSPIILREARETADVAFFWARLHDYFQNDCFPSPDDEDRAWFLSEEYRVQIETLHKRPHDRAHYLLFCRSGQPIGLALAVLYDTEDGKCFLLEFCVFPAFRGGGTGAQCARVFCDWAQTHGATYTELNADTPERRHFWSGIGFSPNGRDEWGKPLMLLPPKEAYPVTIAAVTEADRQLFKLENGFLAEIGEESLSAERQERLSAAVRDGRITFFIAQRRGRAVGMCSVSRCFSTFACADTGQLEDFFIEPVFRKQGIARQLAKAAQSWCGENGVTSLTVCCAPCDEALYQALGFDVALGKTLAYLPFRSC